MNCPTCSARMCPVGLANVDPTMKDDAALVAAYAAAEKRGALRYAWVCDCGTGVEVPPRRCPFCGYYSDDQTQIGGDDPILPEPGAISLCSRCLCVSLFSDRLQLQPLTQVETEALTPDERALIRAAQAAIRRQRASEN